MTNQDFGGETTANGHSGHKSRSVPGTTGEALEKVSQVAQDVGAKAKQAASDTATTIGDHFKDALDQQIGGSITAAGLLASAVKRAAAELDHPSPIVAKIVRSVADRVEQFAEDYDGETVEQLTRSASDFTRRQPALVFGLAAVAGFLMFRTIASAPTAASLSSARPAEPGSAT